VTVAGLLEQRPGAPVEADQVGDHPVEPRGRRVRALGEQAVRRGTVVLEVAGPVADPEAHLRRLRGDRERRQQPLEARVVAVVEDDEAGVDVVGRIGLVDPYRVAVAARVRVGLEHREVVLASQQVGDDQARDPGPDDRYPQRNGHHMSTPGSRGGAGQIIHSEFLAPCTTVMFVRRP
jgi:hypothetical protein